jgi:hypothetical protein
MEIYTVGDGRNGTVLPEYLSRNLNGNVVVCCNNPEKLFTIARYLDHAGFAPQNRGGESVAVFCASVDDAMPLVKTGNYPNVVIVSNARTRTMKKLEKLKNAGVI